MDSALKIARQQAGVDFGRTRWSMVVAVREGDEAQARQSLKELCRRYWVPIYAYVRRRGHAPEDAAVLVRQFLTHLVSRLRAQHAGFSTGFRVYLQQQLEAFLDAPPQALPARDFEPGMEPPWPLEQIEQRQRDEHPADAGPVQALQRAFALELLAIALERLRREARQSGRADLFELVRPFLSREPSPDEFARLAEQMGSSSLASVIAVKRLRQRFQELIDEELAQTVGDAESLENERHTLLTLVLHRPEE
jgi:hypothetical protein